MRRNARQLQLFTAVPQPRRRRESAALYAAVVRLRKDWGLRVFRAGTDHLVNGERMPSRRLLALVERAR